MRTPTRLLLAALFCSAPLFIACGSGVDASADQSDLENAKKHRCTSNANCSHGQVCVSGTCQNPPPQCTSNAQCTGGQVCTGGKCQACTADNQCSAGQVCTNGACGTPTTSGCTSNAQCSGGQVCVSGNCQACTADNQCGSGQVCSNGACGTPTTSGCSTNADCGSGHACVSGACYAQLPQPSSCAANGHGNPGLQAVVTITQYKGLDNNKLHELAVGTIDGNIWSTSSTPITGGVDLAMRLGAGGLPHEIPLAVGDKLELEGFYIDPSANYSHDGNGVIHWTHAPCGYTLIHGVKYQ